MVKFLWATQGGFRKPMAGVLSSYLSHALVFLHRHKLVMHAMDKKDRHGKLSMVDLIALGPVLATHHGPQHKG